MDSQNDHAKSLQRSSNQKRRSEAILRNLLERYSHLDQTNKISTNHTKDAAGHGGSSNVYVTYLLMNGRKIKVALKVLRICVADNENFAKVLGNISRTVVSVKQALTAMTL